METSQRGGRGRPRRAETDDAIVDAARGLMRERGPGAVNVATVSTRSGVARTTIYRRYADRQALLEAVLRPITDRGAPPGRMSVEEKVGWVLARTEEVLADGIGPGGVASVLTGEDPEFGSAIRASLEAGLRPIRDQLASDVSEGVLLPEADPDLLLDLFLGSYLAARLRHDRLPRTWRADTARLLSRTLAHPG